MASPIAYAVAALIIALLCGFAPIFMGVKEDKERLKQLTGIAAGIIIASAMLVVIPEGYELAMTDEHGAEDALAGSVALVILEVDHGDINATEGIEEIEALIGGHGDGHEDEHGHDEEEDGHDDMDTIQRPVCQILSEPSLKKLKMVTSMPQPELKKLKS